MARTEAILGRGCFGAAAEATFGRHVRSIKTILACAGYGLKCSRRLGLEGYYIPERPVLATELAEQVRTAIAEGDPRQIEIGRRLTAAARIQQAGGCLTACGGSLSSACWRNKPTNHSQRPIGTS